MDWRPGSHASTFGGNPVGCAAAHATLDLVQNGLMDHAAGFEPKPDLRNAVIQAAFRRGLLLLGCGESAIRFAPALVVSRDQIDAAMDILDAAMGDALAR